MSAAMFPDFKRKMLALEDGLKKGTGKVEAKSGNVTVKVQHPEGTKQLSFDITEVDKSVQQL